MVNTVNLGSVADTSDNKKRDLSRAARDILIQDGLSGLSMRKVASACDVSATAIYRHFEDKDALLASAVIEGFRIFGSYLMDALEEATPDARFRTMLQRYFDFALENREDYRLIFMTDCEKLGLHKLDEVSEREAAGTFQLLQDRIAECQSSAYFKAGDSRTLAASVWSSVHGLASLFLTGNLGSDPAETQKLIQAHAHLVERALLA